MLVSGWDFSVSDGGGRGGGAREAEGGAGGAPEKPPAEHLPHPAGRPPEPKGHGAAQPLHRSFRDVC